MVKNKKIPVPGYFTSPDGKQYLPFERAEDVPAGWLAGSPEGLRKKGLIKDEAPVHSPPVRPVSDEHKHVPADYEDEPELFEAPKPKRGRPKKDLDL